MENSLSRYRAADKIAVRKFFRYRKGAMRGAFSETPFIYSILCRSKEIVSDRKCTLSVLWEGTHPVVLSHIRILFGSKQSSETDDIVGKCGKEYRRDLLTFCQKAVSHPKLHGDAPETKGSCLLFIYHERARSGCGAG